MLDGIQPINSLTSSENFVKYALDIGAIQLHGDGRVVTYGRGASYSLNFDKCRTGDTLSLLASTFVKKAKSVNLNFDLVFGPAKNGIPLAASIAQSVGGTTEFFFMPNDDETNLDSLFKGKKVVIVADTLLQNRIVDNSVEFIRQHGGIPVGCIIAFDLQEATPSKYSACQNFGFNNGIPAHSIAGLNDLISYLQKSLTEKSNDVEIQKNLDNLLMHQKMYGVQLG